MRSARSQSLTARAASRSASRSSTQATSSSTGTGGTNAAALSVPRSSPVGGERPAGGLGGAEDGGLVDGLSERDGFDETFASGRRPERVADPRRQTLEGDVGGEGQLLGERQLRGGVRLGQEG